MSVERTTTPERLSCSRCGWTVRAEAAPLLDWHLGDGWQYCSNCMDRMQLGKENARLRAALVEITGQDSPTVIHQIARTALKVVNEDPSRPG